MIRMILTATCVEQEGVEEALTVAGQKEGVIFLSVKDYEDPEADVPLQTTPFVLYTTVRHFNPPRSSFLFFIELIRIEKKGRQ